MTWNRLTNGIRDQLVALPVWTTEEDRRRALSFEDRHFLGTQEAIAAVHAGWRAPADLGVLVAVARYEDAGWMPEGSFNRWRRSKLMHTESLDTGALVQWLGFVETDMQRKLLDLESRLVGHCREQAERLAAAQANAERAHQQLHGHREKLILARLSVGDTAGAQEIARRIPTGPERDRIANVIHEMSDLYNAPKNS